MSLTYLDVMTLHADDLFEILRNSTYPQVPDPYSLAHCSHCRCLLPLMLHCLACLLCLLPYYTHQEPSSPLCAHGIRPPHTLAAWLTLPLLLHQTRTLIRRAAIRMSLKRTVLRLNREYRAWKGLPPTSSREECK